MSLKFATGQVTLSIGVAAQIVPARVGRQELRLLGIGESPGVNSTNCIGLGNSSLMSLTTRFLPPQGEFRMGTEEAVYGLYGVSGSPATRIVQYLEIYEE